MWLWGVAVTHGRWAPSAGQNSWLSISGLDGPGVRSPGMVVTETGQELRVGS